MQSLITVITTKTFRLERVQFAVRHASLFSNREFAVELKYFGSLSAGRRSPGPRYRRWDARERARTALSVDGSRIRDRNIVELYLCTRTRAEWREGYAPAERGRDSSSGDGRTAAIRRGRLRGEETPIQTWIGSLAPRTSLPSATHSIAVTERRRRTCARVPEGARLHPVHPTSPAAAARRRERKLLPSSCDSLSPRARETSRGWYRGSSGCGDRTPQWGELIRG